MVRSVAERSASSFPVSFATRTPAGLPAGTRLTDHIRQWDLRPFANYGRG